MDDALFPWPPELPSPFLARHRIAHYISDRSAALATGVLSRDLQVELQQESARIFAGRVGMAHALVDPAKAAAISAAILEKARSAISAQLEKSLSSDRRLDLSIDLRASEIAAAGDDHISFLAGVNDAIASLVLDHGYCAYRAGYYDWAHQRGGLQPEYMARIRRGIVDTIYISDPTRQPAGRHHAIVLAAESFRAAAEADHALLSTEPRRRGIFERVRRMLARA